MTMNILDQLLDKEMEGVDLQSVIDAIEDMASQSYWPSKNTRLQGLLTSEDAAYNLVKYSLGFELQIQELIGILANKISKGIKYEDKVRNASDVIAACNGLVYDCIKKQDHIMVVSKYILEDSTYEYLTTLKGVPPMMIQPMDWVSNGVGGDYADQQFCILGSHHNKHDKPQALDVLNKLQSIAWELDSNMLKYKESPNKKFTSPDSHEQFHVMADQSKKMYKQYKDKPFWFVWQFDKRGRQYSRGYCINIQASGYKKAILNFASKSLIKGEL